MEVVNGGANWREVVNKGAVWGGGVVNGWAVWGRGTRGAVLGEVVNRGGGIGGI